MRARYVTASGHGGTWKEIDEGAPPAEIEHTWPSGLVETLFLVQSETERLRCVSLYPKTSMAIGCSPRQRHAMMRRLEKLGVPTVIDLRGHAVFESRKHQNRVCKALGYVNLDAGYGDHT